MQASYTAACGRGECRVHCIQDYQHHQQRHTCTCSASSLLFIVLMRTHACMGAWQARYKAVVNSLDAIRAVIVIQKVFRRWKTRKLREMLISVALQAAKNKKLPRTSSFTQRRQVLPHQVSSGRLMGPLDSADGNRTAPSDMRNITAAS